MASESIGLAMFVLQRPYLDKLFNLDMILAKSSTLFSFLALGFSTEPTVIRGVGSPALYPKLLPYLYHIHPLRCSWPTKQCSTGFSR